MAEQMRRTKKKLMNYLKERNLIKLMMMMNIHSFYYNNKKSFDVDVLD
jgi:hypothetical protein